VRAGGDLDARFQPVVDLVGRLGHVLVRRQVVFLPADLRRKHPLAVDGDLELVRKLEPDHVADDVTEEEDGEFVFGVLRKLVLEEQTAAGAERQPFDVFLLRIVWRNAVAEPHDVGIRAEREAADLSRGRKVLLQQRRRYAQHAGDVVETVTLIVCRKQRGHVNLEIEQVADGVAVLGAVQTVYRFVPRVGVLERLRVERGFERGDEGLERLLVWTGHALRRHHPPAQLGQRPLPELGVCRRLGRTDAIERHAARFCAIVMAGDAVLLDDCLVRPCRRRNRCRARRWSRGGFGRCRCRRGTLSEVEGAIRAYVMGRCRQERESTTDEQPRATLNHALELPLNIPIATPAEGEL
jgi:hypothetical protein